MWNPCQGISSTIEDSAPLWSISSRRHRDSPGLWCKEHHKPAFFKLLYVFSYFSIPELKTLNSLHSCISLRNKVSVVLRNSRFEVWESELNYQQRNFSQRIAQLRWYRFLGDADPTSWPLAHGCPGCCRAWLSYCPRSDVCFRSVRVGRANLKLTETVEDLPAQGRSPETVFLCVSWLFALKIHRCFMPKVRT